MKYIITDKNEVVVGANTYHQILAKSACVEGRVIAAGHCEMRDDVVMQVWGGSVGYNIQSKQEDLEYMNRSTILVI